MDDRGAAPVHEGGAAPQTSGKQRGRARLLAGATLLGAVVLSGGAYCKGGGRRASDCQGTREYFEQNVWSAFMSVTCTKCHTPDGTAVADSNAKLVLQTSSYPGFIDANLTTLTTVANIQN